MKTQPDNIFSGDFGFIKRYVSESEKQQIKPLLVMDSEIIQIVLKNKVVVL